jgi:hypothetical protein
MTLFLFHRIVRHSILLDVGSRSTIIPNASQRKRRQQVRDKSAKKNDDHLRSFAQATVSHFLVASSEANSHTSLRYHLPEGMCVDMV